MKRSRILLLWCAALVASACQGNGADLADCNGQCDVSDVDQLMPRAPTTPGTIAFSRDGDSWFFEVVGAKGDIALLSDPYASRTSALNGALSVEDNGVLAERYSITSTSGGFAVVLRAGNGQTLAQTKVLASEEEAQVVLQETRDLVAGIVQYKAAMTSGARFELGRDGSDWTFRLLDDDGNAVLVSQAYSRRRDALGGIDSVRNNGKEEARYVALDSPPRFILKAANGQEIAASGATFSSLAAAEAAILSTQDLLVSERVANPW